MEKIIQSIKQNKLIFLMLILAFAVAVFFAKNKKNASRVECYEFLKTYYGATIKLQSVGRGAPFEFLFGQCFRPSFSFNLNLGNLHYRGPCSLWIYTTQADNHGQITINYQGKTVGVVDNQLKEKRTEPKAALSYVGDLDIKKRHIILNVTSSSKDPMHFAELGLIVLAPQGMTRNEIASKLMENKTGPTVDVGLLLIVLGIAYSALFLLVKYYKIRPENKRVKIFLASVVLFLTIITFLLNIHPAQLGISASDIDSRIGIEKMLDSGVKNGIEILKRWGRKNLPNREKRDDVPEKFQISSGLLQTTIYHLNQDTGFKKVSNSIFSGKMIALQVAPGYQIRIFFSLMAIVILGLIVLDYFTCLWWSSALVLAAISILSIILSVRLSSSWDELFINLRHSYMLLNHGVYSINAHTMLEGSVDFLPLFLTALLGLTGINLISIFLSVSLLGNIFLIIFSYLIASKITQNRICGFIAALLLGLYPNVLWVGASGFSAVLFTAWIFASSYYLLFTERRFLGLILLSILTLVRTEGILFAALLLFYIDVIRILPKVLLTQQWRGALKKACIDGCIVITPFLISLLIRYLVFGHSIPNPISFKNTNFDSAYFSTGLNYFFELITKHDLHLLVILVFMLFTANFFACKCNSKLADYWINIKNLVSLNIIIFVFILIYYTGGGDWFPWCWNRYGMSFNLITILAIVILFYGAFFFVFKKWIRSASIIVLGLTLIFGYTISFQNRDNNFIKNVLFSLGDPSERRWERIDKLASLGLFLDKILPANAIVASPEEATIMYFSKRDMLGLLGVSNPEITSMPLQPLNSGDILHRRRGYASVFKHRPDIIALYEPVTTGDFREGSNIKEKVHQQLQKELFTPGMVNAAYYRVGSFDALKGMGYHHLTIVYTDRIFSIFVANRIYSSVVTALSNKGFQNIGSDFIEYSVSPDISKKYVPAVPEIMNIL